MKKIYKFALAAAVSAASAVNALAQTIDVANAMNTATNQVKNFATPIANFISIICGVFAVVTLGWNFIQRSKNEGQSNDRLLNWGIVSVVVLAGIQLIKAIWGF